MIEYLDPLWRAASKAPKTYADFEAWANTQVVGAASAAHNTSVASLSEGLRKVRMSGSGGSMWGSPWNDFNGRFTRDSSYDRIAQHSFLSAAQDSVARSNNRIVLLSCGATIEAQTFGLSRNNYFSNSYEPFSSCICDRFDFFDDESGRICRVNPFARTSSFLDIP